jgi:hypothetical protein
MRKFIPIILLFVFASQNFAQEYFPLQVGNKWHMPGESSYCFGDSTELFCPQAVLKDTLLVEIMDDTLLSNEKTYSVLNVDLGFGKYVRTDNSFIYFYDDSISADVPVFDLNAELNSVDSINFHNSATKFAIWLGEIKEETLFGETVRILKFWVEGGKNSYYDYTKFSIAFSNKFGIVSYANERWVDTIRYQYNYKLSDCIINGIAYGYNIPSIDLPLAVNNSWTFYGTGAECHFDINGEGACLLIELRDTLTFTVIKDTVMANNKTYSKIAADFIDNPGFKFNEKLSKPVFIRADKNYIYLYDDSTSAEIPLLNISGTLTFDDTVYFGPKQETAYNVWISGMEERSKFGQDIKTISHYLFELDTLEFVGSDSYKIGISDKFGFVDFSQTYWIIDNGGDAANQFTYNRFSFKYTLGSCNIGGVVYGDRIGVEPDDEPNAPKSFSLTQNYPNPFNPSTTIEFAVPKQTRVKLTVFDVLGREISVLANDVYSAGNYKATFNGSNLPSGVYLYRLETGSYSQTRKFILLK